MPEPISFFKRLTRRLAALLRIPGGILLRTLREYDRDQCMSRASSLAFSTLLAVVPLTAFVVSLLTAFGTFEELISDLQDFLVQVLVPTRQEEFRGLIEQFVSNSQALGTVGLILFAVTSLNLINNITMNMNALWGSRPRNNFLSRFGVYASTIILGTMFIAVSFTGRKVLSALIPFPGHPVWAAFLVILPSLFMFLTFLILIVAVPRARVKARYALAGALVGVVLWELAKGAFVNVSNYVLRASIMYGSLAVIPIFLFWLYIMWMIILGATELTYSLQYRDRGGAEDRFERLDPAGRITLGIRLYLAVAAAFRAGERPPSTTGLAKKLEMEPADLQKFVEIFRKENLLHVLGPGKERLLPARPLDSITFKDLIEALLGDRREQEEIPEQLRELLRDIRKNMESSIRNLSVDDYLANEIIRDL